MKKMINKFVVAALSLATLLVTGSAWAATPTPLVEWTAAELKEAFANGQTTVTKNGYTLNLNGNAVDANGLPTISSSAGILLDWNASSVLQNCTLLVRYSNWAKSSSTYSYGCAFKISNSKCDDAGFVLNNTSLKCFYDTHVFYSFNGTAMTSNSPTLPSSGYVATIYGDATGTGAIVSSNGLSYSGGYYTGCKWGSNGAVGASIGGPRGTVATSIGAPASVTIEAIALFGSMINTPALATDLSNFWFQDEITTWEGGAEGNWSDATKWSNGVPAAKMVAVIPAGAVVTANADANLTGVIVQGAGTIKYCFDHPTGNNYSTDPLANKLPTGLTDSANWTGTFWLRANAVPNGNQNCGWYLQNYGNANSIVRFSGICGFLCTTGGGIKGSLTANLELKDDGLDYAWRAYSGSGTGWENITCIKGDGKIFSDSVTMAYAFADASEYSGSIQTTAASFLFGGTLSAADSSKKITIAASKEASIAAGKTWSSSGIVINGTLCGAGTLASATTLGATAVLKPTNGGLTITGALTQTEGCAINASGIDTADEADFYPLVSLASTPESYPTVNNIPTGYEKVEAGAVIGIKKTGSDVTIASNWEELAAAITAGKEYIIAGAITDGGSNTATLTKATTIELLGGITGGTIANGGYALTLKTEAPLSVSTQITGAGAVEKTGLGKLTLSAPANTVPMVVSEGVLACSLGETATNAITINEGGTFDAGTSYPRPTINFNGGTLITHSNNGSKIQFSTDTFAKDSVIDAPAKAYIIASGNNQFNFNLNGHKLTKVGVGDLQINTASFVGGGAIEVQDGSLTLACPNLPSGATLDVTINSGKTLTINSTNNKSGSFSGDFNVTNDGGTFTVNRDITINNLSGTGTFNGSNTPTVKGILTLPASATETAMISGNLTLTATTILSFPAGDTKTFKLCTGTLTGATDGKIIAYIGGERKLVALTYDLDNKTVTYAETEPKTWKGGEENSNWSNGANWDDGNVPVSGDFVKLGDEDVVNVDADAVLTGVIVLGTGRIIFTDYAKIPTGSWVLPDWTGTLELKNCTKEGGCRVDLLGNQNSSICFNGFTGYVFGITGVSAFPIATFKNIEIGEGGLNVTGSFGSSTYSSINGNLIGSGTITMSATCSKRECGYEFVGDPSGFTGSVNVSNGSGANMNVGFETERKTNYSLPSNRQIVVGEGVTVGIGADKTWTSDQGVHVYGTIAGSGALASATTFGEGAKIKPAVGGLKFGSTISGSVTINCADIVAEDVNYAALITMTGATKTLPTYTLENATGYVAAEKEGVLYLVKKEVRDFYSKWDAAPGVLTYKSGNLSGGSKLIVFDPVLGVDTDIELTDTTASTLIPGCGGASIVPWKVFIEKSGYNYVAPGHVLRFSGDYTGVAMGGNFAPFNAGGLLVEKGATGYSMTASTSAVRDCYLGDMNGVTPMWTVINESFTFARGGRAQDTFSFVGPVHVEVAEDKIFTISNGAKLDAARSASLIMHGAGTIKFNNGLNATGAVTLDYSDLEVDRDPFIEGNLTVDKDTIFKFPAGFNPSDSETDASFKLCDGTLTGAVNGKRAVAFGDTVKLVDMTFVSDGSVTYVEVDEKSWTGEGTDTNWSTDDNWDPAGKPDADADVKIAVESADIAITLDEDTASLASLTFLGSHDVTFSGTGEITATAIDFAYLTGKVVLGADGLTLNGSITGTMNVDASAVPAGTTFLKGTAIAAANVSFVNIPDGIVVVKTNAGYEMKSATEFLRYGYAFEDNVDKETAASESITIGSVSSYEDGVRTRALAFRSSKNYGTGFGFGGGDFTIFAVIKAPTDANKCIFALGGKRGTDGLLGLRTSGANSVAVFTKDGADLITAAVENSATMFHYYALKYDSTAHTIALSVDGGAFGDPVAYTSGTGSEFQFGGINAGGTSGKTDNANNGAIDEFQLYTAKLTVEQIQSLGEAFVNTWKGENGGEWATTSNWSFNGVPAAGAFVVIPTGDTAEAYKIVLDNNATVSLGLVKITGAATSFEFENGEVTMGELKSSVDILVGANDTLIFPNRKASITLADNKVIKGSGRVVMVGNGLANTLDLLSAQFTGVKDANNWTGTLEFRDWCGMSNANYAKYGDLYGNANSTICFNGFKGHVYAKDFDPIKAYEIGEDGAEFTGQFSSGNIGFIGDLIGSGDLKLSLTGNTAKNGYLRFVGDSSAYTGSFSFAGDNAFPISLIPATDTTMPLAEFSQRMIILAVEAGAWTVNGDVEVIAGASFDTTKAPTINGKIKFDSNILVKTTEEPSADGVLFIKDTQLTPGTISALAITVKVGEDEYTGYHPVTTEEGVVAKIVDVTSWSGEVEITESQNLNAVLVTGNCTVKGIGDNKKVTLGSIAIGDGMTLTLDNVTIEVNELNVLPQAVKLVNGAHLVVNDQMLIFALAANETLEMDAGAQYTFLTVPNFNTASTIKITNAASLQPGNYLLMDWSNWPNPDLMGYGMPQLNVEGYTGEEGSSIRLVPEAYKLWLQVRSAAEMARPALTIEPIGDSITEGLNNAGGSGKNYRIPLFNKLSLAGYNVKSVGYWNHSGAGNYSLDPSGANATTANPDWAYHSGRGSARAGAVSGGNARVRDAWANDIDVGGAPDIVLLHIGINDMLNNGGYNDTDGTKTYEYITNIVTGILRDRPDVKLVMSSPMANAHGHSEQTATYEDEPGKRDTNHKFCEPLHEMCLAFYDAVKEGELLKDIPGAKDRLFFADQYLAVQPSWYDDSKLYLNDGSDHCHPNWLGHELMAETWLAQIKEAFPDPEDKAEKFHSRRTNKGTYQYGAENNVPGDYLKGFKKVRVFNTSLTGTEQLTPGTPVTYNTTDSLTPDEAAVAKVGYYVEYVRETSTTNIHRFVWVDMDAFGGKNVADIGIPTMGNFQEVVNKLHVYGNHPAVFNIPADDDTVKGFIEFTPHTYDDNNIPTITGAPAHFAPYDWHDHLSDTGAHGCMQVHRILDPADQLRPAQVVFAYNAFTANGGNDQNTVLGIGNFSQSFQSSSTDWTNLHQSETCNATVYSVRNIEIWIKAAASDDSGKSYDTIEEAINKGTTDEQGVTQITINTSDPMPIDITQIGGKAFKLKGTSEGTVTWTETATKSASGKYISYKDGVMTVKEGTFPNVSFVENGLQAAALGIDVSNANDKPYLKSVQDDSTTMVKFNFYHGTAVDGIINPTGIGGLTVKYAVEYANDAGFTDDADTTEPTDESSVSVALPTDTNKKTRYYRPKFSFGN